MLDSIRKVHKKAPSAWSAVQRSEAEQLILDYDEYIVHLHLDGYESQPSQPEAPRPDFMLHRF